MRGPRHLPRVDSLHQLGGGPKDALLAGPPRIFSTIDACLARPPRAKSLKIRIRAARRRHPGLAREPQGRTGVDGDALLQRVRSWVGLTPIHNAEHTIDATLRALSDTLLGDDAVALARDLPCPLARILRHGAHGSMLSLHEFYRRVARYEDVPLPSAVDHARAVCRALGSLLPSSVVARLWMALPHLALLFVPPAHEPRPPRSEGLAVRSRQAARTTGRI
jgi:uncharacterized protein (DUF2267 family)